MLEAHAPVRRRDAAATRAAILASAREHFAHAGYDGALLKAIAEDAGVDAALINRYFGGKEGLFAAVLETAVRAEPLLGGRRSLFGATIAATLAGLGGTPRRKEGLQNFQIIMRAATSRAAAPLLNEAVRARVLAPISAWLGGADAEVRARLICAVIIGVLVEAAVRGGPLDARDRAQFAARLGVLLQTIVEQ